MNGAIPIFAAPERFGDRFAPPAVRPSGDTTLWSLLLWVGAWFGAGRTALQIYAARWRYATTRPAATGRHGRHAKPVRRKGSARHVRATPLLQQIGISRRVWDAVSALEERVEAPARLA